MLQPVSARYGDPFPFLGTSRPGCARTRCLATAEQAQFGVTEPLHPIASSADSFTSLCHLSARATGDLMGALGDPPDLTAPATALLGVSVLLQPQDPMAWAACGESAATGTTRS